MPAAWSADDVPTLAEWFDWWLSQHDVMLTTIDSYRSVFNARIAQWWGDSRLDCIDSEEVLVWYRSNSDRPKARDHAFTLLRRVLVAAVDYGLLAYNVCEGLDLEREPVPVPQGLTLSDVKAGASPQWVTMRIFGTTESRRGLVVEWRVSGAQYEALCITGVEQDDHGPVATFEWLPATPIEVPKKHR